MKTIDAKIQEAVAKVDLRKPETLKEAANTILTEDGYVNAGETVAIIDDPTYPYSGQKARVIGPADKGGGWVDVEFANGVRFPVQSSLLLKIK
jgi:hypothetical protein